MEEGVGKTPVALPSIESKNTPLDVRLPTPKPDVAKKIEKVVPGQAENWNTRNLGLRVAADGASALSAGLLVAPVITMIDKYASPSLKIIYYFLSMVLNRFPEQSLSAPLPPHLSPTPSPAPSARFSSAHIPSSSPPPSSSSPASTPAPT